MSGFTKIIDNPNNYGQDHPNYQDGMVISTHTWGGGFAGFHKTAKVAIPSSADKWNYVNNSWNAKWGDGYPGTDNMKPGIILSKKIWNWGRGQYDKELEKYVISGVNGGNSVEPTTKKGHNSHSFGIEFTMDLANTITTQTTYDTLEVIDDSWFDESNKTQLDSVMGALERSW